MSFSISKEDIVKEILKSGKDPAYFINNYVKISHPLRGLVPFKTYDFQTALLHDFNDYRFNVVLKARQLGISTITAAYVAWMMLFHRDKNVLVIATKFGTAANIVKKVKAIHKHLPEWIKISDILIDNRTSFELTNGSQIKASSTSADAGRSEALSLLVIDEAAHVEGLDGLWTGLYPTLSTGGRCIALSTPNGVGNWFHQTCVDAEISKNDFHLVTLPWQLHPDRDQEWFDKETMNMSRRQIAQELECNFNMSGETVFHPDDMKIIESMLEDPKYRAGFDRNLWIWEEYKPESTYILTADVARGDGQDYSTFLIFKIETNEIAAEYQGKATPDLFANLLAETGKEFGDCMIVVENNNVGWAVLNKLEEQGYPNIYYSRKSTHEQVESYLAEAAGVLPGFATTMKTRPLIIAKLEEFVRNKLITIKSKRLFNEMKTFIWQNGKPQAMSRHNDDLIIACAIGCWIKETVYSTNQRSIEYQKVFLSAMASTDKKLNTSMPGMLSYEKIKRENNLEDHSQEYKDFLWLLKG